jgi:hypothetical protein
MTALDATGTIRFDSIVEHASTIIFAQVSGSGVFGKREVCRIESGGVSNNRMANFLVSSSVRRLSLEGSVEVGLCEVQHWIRIVRRVIELYVSLHTGCVVNPKALSRICGV